MIAETRNNKDEQNRIRIKDAYDRVVELAEKQEIILNEELMQPGGSAERNEQIANNLTRINTIVERVHQDFYEN